MMMANILAACHRTTRLPLRACREVARMEVPSYLRRDCSINFSFDGNCHTFCAPGSRIYRSALRHNLSEASIGITRKLGRNFSTRNVIDIGSNIGYAAANYYFSWRPDKIYCFEPSTYNFSYLQRNLAQFSEIELFNVGISDRSGEANLAMPSLSQNRRLLRKFNNTGLLSIHGESNFKKEKVSLISLDEWAEKKKLNIKDFFIKIDVEGHELFALNGMRAALKNGNVVQIEINPDALAAASCSGKQVHQYFADFGYKPIFAIVPDVLEYESVVSRSILNQTHDVVFAKT